MQATVPQSGEGEVPEVLHRFRAAMLGMGKIVGPNEYGIYVWKTRGFEETQATIALLWRYLGAVKRAQASAAIREVLDGYRSGRLKARPSRRASNDHVTHAATCSESASEDDFDRAWAAGFLDAEGCFGTYHSRPRKGGPDWYRIRVSATQHGVIGVPAEVLVRLHRALGGLGRIEKHGDPDDFRWLAEGTEAVDQVLARTGRWLGTVKADQAQLALRRFRAQVRLQGTATHCVRGHEYSGSSMRGGRLRRICRPCDRINARLRRAAAGILPRQFRNEARRYTF
ncbi:MAG: hypothetical protein E6H89_02440 [Chloroflexi bacterium]|nr:MAG: hypothetical protein E6I49_07795 [Chloroflexota bacterium]TMG54567.1 MAG: hypothetical protein E6H89_02440 [Chloroflexota bacterium]